MNNKNVVCGDSLNSGFVIGHQWIKKIRNYLLLIGLILFSALSIRADSNQVVLISTNDFWKYNDNGIDLGTAWRGLTYDDSQWLSGRAEFGYGDGDEVTTNKWGPDPNNKYPTYYYRKTINITNLNLITNIICHFLRDDGIVVYVNGALAFWNNFPSGTTEITFTTYANVVGGAEETNWFTTNINKSLFREGQNVIAVEIHQNSATSSDISFNLALIAQYGAPVNQPPTISLLSPTNNTIFFIPTNITISASAGDSDGSISRVEFYSGSQKLGEVLQPVFKGLYTFLWTNAPVGIYRIYAVAIDDVGAKGYSQTNTVNVFQGQSVVWRAFNDHYAGPNTHSNATAWNPLGTLDGAPGNSGNLKDIATGRVLPAILTITTTSSTTGGAMGKPNNGTPAGDWFNPYIDFGSGALQHAVMVIGDSQYVTYTFTGLNPNCKYIFKGTAVRGNNYFDRWSKAVINGAQSFRSAHIPVWNAPGITYFGALTSEQVPASLGTNEVAWNVGENRSDGVMVVWEDIVPSPGGSFSVTVKQYTGTVPTGQSTAGIYGYAFSALSLEAVSSPPIVVLTSPTNNAVFTTNSILLTVDVASLTGISSVSYFAGSNLIATVNSQPYSYLWSNISGGNYQVYAVANDSSGAVSTSGVVNVQVFINQPPQISITSPQNNSTFLAPANITITANATDPDGSVSIVEFYEGTTKIGEAKSQTSTFTYNWNNVGAGDYVLTAIATDNSGLRATSAPVAIKVIAPSAGWVAFNDHVRGDYTHPNATTWNIFGDSPGNSGPLKDISTGSNLTARLTITYYGNVQPATTAGRPAPGTPLYNTFNGYVDFGTATYGIAQVLSNGYVVYTFTNLNPNARYSFKGGVVRGNDAYTNRWTIAGIQGAVSYRSAHTANALTYANYPNYINTNEAAINTGLNHTPTTGDMWVWEDIDPGPDGSFSVYCTQYTGPAPNTKTDGPYGYAIGGIRLQEYPGAAFITILSPTNNQVFTAPVNITIQASAISPVGVSNVSFYGNSSLLGVVSSAPYNFVWSNTPVGTNSIYAVLMQNNGQSVTSSVVQFIVNAPPVNTEPPTIAQVIPAPGTVGVLTNIQIIFSEPVINVDASDLLINGVPATSVAGGGSNYIFSFPQPSYGTVVVSWTTNHGIVDIGTPPLSFDSGAPNATWSYYLTDLTPPTILSISPPPGSTVNQLVSVTVIFSEPVTGVNASDLLINGAPAIGLTGGGTNYTFYFPQPAYGTVVISWAANHGITDLASPPNPFNGANAGWQYNFEAPKTVLVETNALWRLKKGTSEASSPIDAWRFLNFDDSSWSESPAPFYYDVDGTPVRYTGNTLLNDMRYNYTTIYLRHRLLITNLAYIKSITISTLSDDGYILWINGNELIRYNTAVTGDIAYNNPNPAHNAQEPLTRYSYTFTNLSSFLINGTNLIAVQGLNANLTSSDFLFNMEMTAVIADPSLEPPRIGSINPPPGEVYYLTNITVVFTEPVTNVDASDLLINSVPAASISGAGNVYTFYFPQPAYGAVSITWATNHNIIDFDSPPKPFNGNEPGATFAYTLLNPNAPVIISKTPSAGATVSNLTQVTVTFSKPVINVDAGDLLINGSPASGITGDGQTFTFTFTQPSYGAVYISWAQNHGIVDALDPNNVFDRTRPEANWQYNLIDLTPPAILSQQPPAGSYVTNLTQITITFTEPVVGVDARDLLINGIPATSVSGGGAVYTFTFPVPNGTVINITWSSFSGITDLAPAANQFNENAPGSSWQYYSPDTIPPGVRSIEPAPGTTVRDLTRISVLFNEPVTGVDASDLLINGIPAQSVSGSGAGPYVFTFNQPSNGTVQVSWAANHGITDLASPPNSFIANQWNYVLDPNARFDNKVIISEIMFNPPSHRTNDEWIEIHNTHDAPINLTGWRFTRGVDFTFPNIIIPAGGYLVIAADTNAFKAIYPDVTNVIGNWVGRLSNIDEKLRLENAFGELVNEVHYATEGDWAIRRRGSRVWNYSRTYRGWEWYNEADGLGKSIELIQPNLPNIYGQNWKTSTNNLGTPGRANSVAKTNIPPMILDVVHYPAVPAPTNEVTIKARILDEETNNITVTLYWRDATSTTPPSFNSMPMYDDGAHNDALRGDMIFAAQIPPMPNNSIVEFYVEAVDRLGQFRTWPAPAYETNGVVLGQVANALYQVDANAPVRYKQPIYRLIMTGAERQELQSIWADDSIGRRIDAEMNGTFIATDDTGTDVRYLCGFRNRGNGTRSATPHNFRVNIPNDKRWKGQQAFNLNTMYTHSQVMGTIMFRKAGLPVEDSFFVRVRVNGADLANPGSPQYGCYVHLEELNTDWAQNHFPLDGGGNLYRCMRVANLRYLGTNWVTYTTGGNNYSKQSNKSENDWSDLFNLTYTFDNTPDATWHEGVSQVIDVLQWQRYFAVMSLVGFGETALGSDGTADDYTIYRGEYDTRFKIIPHDNDTDFGEGDYSRRPPTDSIFRAADATSDTTFVSKFLRRPEFVPMYYGQLYELATTIFQTNEIYPALDYYLGDVIDTTTMNRMKTWVNQRVANVLSQINLNLTITNIGGLTTNQGYLYTTSQSLTLAGLANVIHTRQVRVAGTQANWVAWNGNWQATINLNPGINTILVQSINSNNVVFAQTNITVWYDKGSVTTVSGTLSGNPTWTPANGPYYVSSSITIPSGSTLTIQPGTTVYLNTGANITVANGGRLLAEGTTSAPIRFTRQPGSTGRWGGITINGSVGSPETRITYAYIEYNGTTAIHSSGGTVYLSHLTFGSTDYQYLSLDNSSFVVSDSTFPTPTGSFEPIHGTGGIKSGGRGIFIRNFVGAPNGYNDAIDFTGGNRPGEIVQFLYNVFMGSGDDILDLDGTDAWVEGNIFLHTHKNGSPDTSSAVSGGRDGTRVSRITIINNIVYDCDHLALAKEGNFYVVLNNTIVRQTLRGGTDTISGVINVAEPGTTEGAGMYLEGNIIYDAEQLIGEPYSNAVVVVTNNLMPFSWNGLGGNNFNADPMFKYIPNLSETYFTNWAQAQVMWDWFSLKPGSPAIGAGAYGNNLGASQQGGVVLAGVPEGLTSRGDAVIKVGINRSGNGIPINGWQYGAGYTHYKWRFVGGQWSSEIPIDIPIVLTNLMSGTYRIEVAGKRDCGFYQDDPIYTSNAFVTVSREWSVNRSMAPIRINEVLAANRSAFIHYDSTPDLIELYNESDAPVSIAGMSITDDPTNPAKFIFPQGTTIPARGYLVLYANNPDGTPGLHLGFNINQEGEGVYLYDRAENGGALIDSVEFGPQITDLSIGRLADGSWGLTLPTFGAPNKPAPLGDNRKVRINEWLASGGYWFQSDFIELYNPESLPVAIGGMYLTDRTGYPTKHKIVPLTFIAPKGYLVFAADGDTSKGALHTNFRLAYENGQIELYDTATNLVDIVVYLTQKPGVSQGRSPDGSAKIASFNQPTPGLINPTTIPGGGSGEISVILVNYTDKWRYEQSGTDLGTNWISVNYDDSTWSEGNGTLGNETAELPVPINTQLTLGQITYYFRKTFVVTNQISQFNSLRLSYLIDDGAVFYLNGREIHRIRMNNAGSPVQHSALADSAVDNAIIEGPITLPTSILNQGTNYLAVEVHQATATSSDIVFAMLLEGIVITNQPVPTSVAINEVLAINSTLREPDDSTPDWVELYNSSGGAVDLSGWWLTDDLTQPQKWIAPQGLVIPAYSYLKILCDGNKPASTNNTGFGLKGSGGAVYLFAPNGVLIDSINYGIQTADFSIGRVPDGGTNWVLTLPTGGGANIAVGLGNYWMLKINEWMPNDSGGKPDWFEIYNPQSQPVAIGGLKVTDDLTRPDKTIFPPLSFIGALTNGYLKLIADNNLAAGADHVAFKLDNTSESIGLFTANNQLIDSITYYNPSNGVSEGRFPDGSTNIVRFYKTSSPGAPNYLLLTNIVINEVLAHSLLPLEDAIELYNPTDESVDISGWYLSDSDNNLKKYRIPQGTIIPARGYKVFYEYEFNTDPGVNPNAFALSSLGEQVYLSTADSLGELTGYRAMVKFGASPVGVSFGRYVNSVGEEDLVAMSQRTFGVDDPGTVEEFRQGQGAPNSSPKVGPVVISEIMYHPPDIGTNDNVRDEFIEIYNNSNVAVPLYDPAYPTNTWRLRDAVDFDFPQGIVLQPYGYLLIVSFDPQTDLQALAEFKAQYRIMENALILGPYRGKLANDNENIELYQPLSPVLLTNSQGEVQVEVPYVLVERVHYYDSGYWPVEADGGGYSLHRVSFTGYANDPTNWVAGAPTPGPQGLQIVSQPQSVNAVCGQDVSFTVVVSGQEPISYQWYFNGVAIGGETNATLALVNVCTNNSGNYYVIAANNNGAVTSAVATLNVTVAQAPLAQPDNVVGLKNRQLVIPVGVLLANDQDFNGSTLSIIGVSGSSTNGGTVVLQGDNVIYTPVSDFAGIDEFNYTVRNRYGLQAVGNVFVTVALTTNYNRIIPGNSGGLMRFEFEGLPSYTYEILKSYDLIHWTVIQEIQAGQDGRIEFTEENGNANHTFYRIRKK